MILFNLISLLIRYLYPLISLLWWLFGKIEDIWPVSSSSDFYSLFADIKVKSVSFLKWLRGMLVWWNGPVKHLMRSRDNSLNNLGVEKQKEVLTRVRLYATRRSTSIFWNFHTRTNKGLVWLPEFSIDFLKFSPIWLNFVIFAKETISNVALSGDLFVCCHGL